MLNKTKDTQLKKTFAYATQEQMECYEGLLRFIKAVTGKTISDIITEALNDKYIPSNKEAAHIVRDLYSEKITLIEAYQGIFSLYAAGSNMKARWNNGLSIINQFSSDISRLSFPIGDDVKGDVQYLLQNIRVLLKLIPQDDDEDNVLYESQLKLGQFYYDEIENEPQFFKPINLVTWIKDNWDCLSNNTYTYRTLVGLCMVLKNTNCNENAYDLIQVISEASKKWN